MRRLIPFWSLVACAAVALSTVGCGGTGQATGPTETCQEVDLEGGGTIPEAPNGAEACGAGVCNYQTQEGCSDGEACTPVADRATTSVVPSCVEAGTKQRDEACTEGETECGAGLFCFEGACRKICCGGDWSACGPEESCLRQLQFRIDGRDVAARMDLCAPKNTCDILDPTACADVGRVCRIVDPTGAVGCAPPSDRDLGDACDAQHQCGPVQHCIGGTCRRLCPLDACGEASCAGGDVCVHFARDPEGVGECTPNWN